MFCRVRPDPISSKFGPIWAQPVRCHRTPYARSSVSQHSVCWRRHAPPNIGLMQAKVRSLSLALAHVAPLGPTARRHA